MTPDQQRQAVVDAARSWLRTPYHHGASLKGVGVDCARLIDGAFTEAGLIDPIDPGFYTHDWHLHRGEERYLAFIEKYCMRIDADEFSVNELEEKGWTWSIQPGDILMWRLGRTFSHGCIVTEWPNIIHSYLPERMVVEASVLNTPMAVRPMRVYSYWGTA